MLNVNYDIHIITLLFNNIRYFNNWFDLEENKCDTLLNCNHYVPYYMYVWVVYICNNNFKTNQLNGAQFETYWYMVSSSFSLSFVFPIFLSLSFFIFIFTICSLTNLLPTRTHYVMRDCNDLVRNSVYKFQKVYFSFH